MASSNEELEQQLTEAGKKLEEPPSPVDELLSLLDQVENCLARVEQSPTESMQKALSPSQKALVDEKLFKHSDVDVKVSVAACISEITRITAPDAPYDDEQMKEVFQLIVSSFENLSDKSSRSYAKRTSILETVAKVRSCVVMLDLECDALIIEMFQHFLKAIRDHHPENVFSSMETIMTLVVEESEDISLELLSPILECVRKDNDEVLPIARKLGERVLEACSAKLKPYLLQAVKSMGISLDDYSSVVSSICHEESSVAVAQNDADVSKEHKADENESKSPRASPNEATQVDKEIATEAASAEQVDPADDRSPKLVVNNGTTQAAEGDFLADSNPLKKQEPGHLTDQSKSVDTSGNAEHDTLATDKLVNAEQKPEQTTKRKGKKSSSLLKLTEPSDSSHVDGEKYGETLLDHKSAVKEIPRSPHEEPSVERAVSSETEKDTATQISSPRATEGESTDVPLSPSGSIPNESRAQRTSRAKKKESFAKETMPSAEDFSKKASEGTSDSEAKPHKHSGKKVLTVSGNEDKTSTEDALKKESGSPNDSEAKLPKQSTKKVDSSNNNGDGSSIKQPDDKKRREKAISGKDITKSSTKDDKEILSSPKSAAKPIKDEHQLEEAPKTNSKRKRTPGKEKATDSREYGENLVGSKVKVWWPKDKMYYKGVITSFDPVRKKHKVIYNDGDKEVLNLKKERWEFIEGDSDSDEEQAADCQSPDASSEMPLKKVKTSSDQSSKQGKIEASAKRGGGASSSKSKVPSTKSGRKSKDESKGDGKPKDGSRSTSKLENDNVSKSKDHTPKSSSKSVDVASKLASKSKNDALEVNKSGKSKEGGTGTPKALSKSKQDTPKTNKFKQETSKTSLNAKGKSPKAVGKSSANGTGKSKLSSSKVKENEDIKDSPDSAKVSSPSKTQGSETMTGKKRRRGSKT